MTTNLTRRSLLFASGSTLLPAVSPSAWGQTFPQKPINLIVAFTAGGPADAVSRIVAQEAATALGQPIIVDNRPGAGGKIAMQALLRAPRDGHTIAYISSSIMSIAPLVDKNLGYDTGKDILPLTTSLRSSNLVAVHPSVPARNLAELVAYAKANPGKLNYGSIGNGSWYHIATEKLLLGLGIEATHVPYKGEANAITDLVAGNLQLMIVSWAAKNFLDEGKLVGLAATGAKPAMHMPSAPTVRDSGFPALRAYDETPWVGFGLGAGVPGEVVKKLHAALVGALQTPAVRGKLAGMGEIQTCTPQELQGLIAHEMMTNKQLIDSGRVKLN